MKHNLLAILITCGILHAIPAKAVTYRVSHTLNTDIWMFKTSASSLQLRNSKDKNEKLEGELLTLSVGKGFIRDQWAINSTVDIITGPFRPIQNGELEADYNGLGLSVLSHYALSSNTLRSQPFSLSAVFGLNYQSLKGSTLGQNDTIDKDYHSTNNDGKVTSYSFDHSSGNVLLGLSFNWILQARQHGNHPDLLKTRVEGYSLGLLAQVPIYSSFDSETTSIENTSGFSNTSTEESSGSYSGLSIIVSLSTYISG